MGRVLDNARKPDIIRVVNMIPDHIAELPRELTPRERGAIWKVALAIVQIANTSGHGTITIHLREGRVDMIDTGTKSKDIPELSSYFPT